MSTTRETFYTHVCDYCKCHIEDKCSSSPEGWLELQVTTPKSINGGEFCSYLCATRFLGKLYDKTEEESK